MAIAASRFLSPTSQGLIVNNAKQLVHVASGFVVTQFEVETMRRGPMAFNGDEPAFRAMQLIDFGDHKVFARLTNGNRIPLTMKAS